MKNFFSKNWKNILLIIGGIFLVIDLFYVITTPATVANDFLKYGPDVEQDIFDTTDNITGEIKEDFENSSENSQEGEESENTGFVNQMAQSTGLNPNVVKGIIVFTLVVVGILILSNIMDGSSGGGKKK